MPGQLIELFEDEKLVHRIKQRLPFLFQLAEIESSRAGRIGMEVGSLRERIVVALLIYKFGEENVDMEIPITEPEVDVRLFGSPIAIKTITSTKFGGVKLIWTVDIQKARDFRESYCPSYDMLFIQINWDDYGGFYYIPLKVQRKLFNRIGRDVYIKLPKPGTNPRGVEIDGEALKTLAEDKETIAIDIQWQRSKIECNPYKRWVDYWKEGDDNVLV